MFLRRQHQRCRRCFPTPFAVVTAFPVFPLDTPSRTDSSTFGHSLLFSVNDDAGKSLGESPMSRTAVRDEDVLRFRAIRAMSLLGFGNMMRKIVPSRIVTRHNRSQFQTKTTIATSQLMWIRRFLVSSANSTTEPKVRAQPPLRM